LIFSEITVSVGFTHTFLSGIVSNGLVHTSISSVTNSSWVLTELSLLTGEIIKLLFASGLDFWINQAPLFVLALSNGASFILYIPCAIFQAAFSNNLFAMIIHQA
jgi:hypothetical protein